MQAMTTNEPTPATDDAAPGKAWLWAIVLLALGLRLIRLGTFPYWHDEVHNLIASQALYGLLVHGDLASNHPPLPYVLVAVWRALGLGGSEWTMRLLPVLFGVGGVVAINALTGRLFGARAGLWAAFLLAVSPLQLHHSQDLKEYIYLPCVAMIMGWWFCEAVDSGRMRDWLIYGALAGLACYTEIFVGPLLVALNVWAMAQFGRNTRQWRGWIAGNTLGALLFLPWFSIMLRKAAATMIDSPNFWIPKPSLVGIMFYFKAVAFGYTAANPWFRIAFALYAVLVIAGFVVAWRANRKGAILLAMWAVVPVAIVYVVSHYTQSIFLIRAMLPYAMALYMLAGVGLAALRPRWTRLGALGAVGCIAGIGLFHELERDYPPLDFPHRPGTHPPRDYSGAAKFVLNRWEDGDVVVHCAGATWLPFYWYGFRNMPNYFGGIGAPFINEIKMNNPANNNDPSLEDYWPQEPQKITANAKRIWFVFAEWERKYLVGNASVVYRWLDAHYTEVEYHPFMGIDLFLYVPSTTTTTIARDEDDGVSALVTLSGSRNDVYRKVTPDAGLVATPVETRQGRLTLAFDATPAGAPIRLAGPARPTRRVGFRVENNATASAEARIECVPSDAMVDLASLFETDPQSEGWKTQAMFNAAPPPHDFNLSTLAGNFADGAAVSQSPLAISPGEYNAFLYTLGAPGNQAFDRAPVNIRLGGADILAPRTVTLREPLRWFWLSLGSAKAEQNPVPLRVEAYPVKPNQNSWTDLAYLALVKPKHVTGMARPAWTAAVNIPAGTTEHFTMELDDDSARVDIWVYEYTEGGKGYRIYRQFRAAK